MSKDEIIWGAAAIGAVINRNGPQTLHLLNIGAIPGHKVGGTWTSTLRLLRGLRVPNNVRQPEDAA